MSTKNNTFWNALNSIAGSNDFFLVISVIGGSLILIATAAYYHKKKVKNPSCCFKHINDDSDPSKLVYLALSFIDYVTDCAWTIEVASTHGINDKWTKRASAAVLIPYIVNLVSFIAVLSYFRVNPGKRQHMPSNSWIERH